MAGKQTLVDIYKYCSYRHSLFLIHRQLADKRRAAIRKTYVLSGKQKELTDEYFLKFLGKKVPYDWHQFYAAFTGKFDYRFLPEFLFCPEIERILNKYPDYETFSDKTFLPLLTAGIDGLSIPKTVFLCSNYHFKDGDGNLVSKDRIIEDYSNYGDVFLKPTVFGESGSGRKCSFFHFENGVDVSTGKTITNIVSSYGADFIAQEPIKTSKELAVLNPTSVNTFRIITCMLHNQVIHGLVVLRIGRNRERVDNAHAGGIFVGVDDNGFLSNVAFSEFNERFSCHPDSKVIFSGYRISQLSEAIRFANILQSRLPQVGLISWDFTIGEDGKPILVEANMRFGSVWLAQCAHGKAVFGNNTDQILALIRNNHRW